MTTLFYGDKPGSDVEPGNRVDMTNGVGLPAPPPMRPSHPTPTPWVGRQPFALHGMVLGIAAAAVVLAGVAAFSVALVWSQGMTRAVQVVLMIIGGYLIAAGVAYVASRTRETA